MTRISCFLIGSLWAMGAVAAEPARVMLFGTFHFQDPGKDMVKVEDVNVLSGENQEYLEALTGRLAGFEPTVVLLEYDPDNDGTVNERYRAYLEGGFELPANEIYQLGFRIAKKAGLERVHSFDHRELHWNPQPMFDYAEQHDSAEMERFNRLIEEFTAQETQARRTMALGGLLMRANDPQLDRLNMDAYLTTNPIGAGDGWAGADATASWWQRNFRMYAVIQQHAQPGERIIAIGGQGHTAILKTLLEIDRRLQAVDVRPYLRPRSG